MTELNRIEPARPMRNLLIGLGIPAAVIAAFAMGGALALMLFAPRDYGAVLAGAGTGAIIGLLASFYGLADIIIGEFLLRGRAMNRMFRTAGYGTAWLLALSALLYWRY